MKHLVLVAVVGILGAVTAGCGGSSSTSLNETNGTPATGGSAGDAGSGGSSGAAGTGGTGGSAGSAGTGGAGGSSGTGGSAGTGGDPNAYHQLPQWVSPNDQPNHHGRYYFLGNQGKDNNGAACTDCHGADLEGGGTAPACSSCHSGWKSNCTFCHGTPPSQNNPPTGVYGETDGMTSLGVGRHAKHLATGTSHQAFACTTCHTVPSGGDINHTQQYVPSSNLSTAGHHGDVTFSGQGTGTTFNADATSGTPASARGTCTGKCHQNGHGGPPNVLPYWAGGAWPANSCNNCHNAYPSNPTHSENDGPQGGGHPCSQCHPGASQSQYSSANHMNGTINAKTCNDCH